MDYLERAYQEPIFGDGYQPMAESTFSYEPAAAAEPSVTEPQSSSRPMRAGAVAGSLLSDPVVQGLIAIGVVAAAGYLTNKLLGAMHRRHVRKIAEQRAAEARARR